jgi:hydrogenase 3 maturation protease
MLEKLQLRIQGKKVLILGVGNRLRGDDVVGSILAERLGKKLNIPIIDAADVPENYLGPIEASGADLVIVLDAADLGASPGDLSLVEREQLKEIGISTHTGNLALLFKVIPQARRPEAVLVAIQPEQTGADRGLSRSVEMAMEGLERLLIRLLRKKMDGSPTAVQS